MSLWRANYFLWGGDGLRKGGKGKSPACPKTLQRKSYKKKAYRYGGKLGMRFKQK